MSRLFKKVKYCRISQNVRKIDLFQPSPSDMCFFFAHGILQVKTPIDAFLPCQKKT